MVKILLPPERYEEYQNATLGSDVLTCAEVTDEDIIEQIMEETRNQKRNPDPDGDEIVGTEQPPSNKDMSIALEKLKSGLYALGCQDFALIQRFEREVNRMIVDFCTQAKPTRFFS